MSGILYVVMAILVILVILLTTALRRAVREVNSREEEKTHLKAFARQIHGELYAARAQDLATFEMHLNAKDQQIADIRRETEDEMRKLFEDLVNSLHSEIDRLCEERSKLIRTVNLQAAQLEELEKQPEEAKPSIDENPLNSDFSGICINGVPLSVAELDLEFDSALQAEYPSVWLYGDNDLLSLSSWDHLYETEIASYKSGLNRGERMLHRRKDNTRQSSYRQVSINLRKARKLVELQGYDGS